MAVDLIIARAAEELYDVRQARHFYLGQGCYCWLQATATKRWVQLPEEQLHCIKWTQGLCSSTLSSTTGTEEHKCLKIQFLAFAAELLLPLGPKFLNLNIKTKVINIRRKWTASNNIPHKDRKATGVWIKKQDLLQEAADHSNEGNSPAAALGETVQRKGLGTGCIEEKRKLMDTVVVTGSFPMWLERELVNLI